MVHLHYYIQMVYWTVLIACGVELGTGSEPDAGLRQSGRQTWLRVALRRGGVTNQICPPSLSEWKGSSRSRGILNIIIQIFKV